MAKQVQNMKICKALQGHLIHDIRANPQSLETAHLGLRVASDLATLRSQFHYGASLPGRRHGEYQALTGTSKQALHLSATMRRSSECCTS